MDLAVVLEVGKKNVFVGIDVHKTSYSVCALMDGKPIFTVRMPAEPAVLVRWIKNNLQAYMVFTAYEAGFSGFVLHRVLTAAGVANVVVNPASIPVAVNDRVKTDKRDAKKIAFELSKGALHGIYVPTIGSELARLLPRTRAQLVKEKTRISNQIKGKLFEFGFLTSDSDEPMSLKSLKEFEGMDLPEELAFSIQILATLFRKIHECIIEIERKMQVQAAGQPCVEAIYRSVPGVGPVSSRVLATELGDLSRFPNERALFSYTGLTPSEYSSGDRQRKGGITRQGNTRVRHCLVEIAWRAIQRDEDLKKKYEELKIRCGGKRAIVAVARRLVGQMRACMRDQTPYKQALQPS